MDEGLLAAYQATAYQVRLNDGRRATLRIGEPLPASLHPMVGNRPWGFITAWNPASQPRPRQQNRMAQRQLLRTLREWPGIRLHAGVGAGPDGWQEPSLFVIGATPEQLDPLALCFGQNAYVHGMGTGAAMLRLMPVS